MAEIKSQILSGQTFKYVLAHIVDRPDSECLAAYDWFDQRCEGATIDGMSKLAATDMPTHMILHRYEKLLPEKYRAMSDLGREYLALAIEHQVRRQKMI